MAQIIDSRHTIDPTIKIFDSFYAWKSVVNGNEFDIVNGYFTSIIQSKSISGNFTAMLFRIAQETGVPVLELLGYIKGSDKLKMNQILAYYLNSFKSKTSLYGVSIVPQANQPVARNIVQ